MKPIEQLREAYFEFTNRTGKPPKTIFCSRWFYERYAAVLTGLVRYENDKELPAGYTFAGVPVIWREGLCGGKLVLEEVEK